MLFRSAVGLSSITGSGALQVKTGEATTEIYSLVDSGGGNLLTVMGLSATTAGQTQTGTVTATTAETKTTAAITVASTDTLDGLATKVASAISALSFSSKTSAGAAITASGTGTNFNSATGNQFVLNSGSALVQLTALTATTTNAITNLGLTAGTAQNIVGAATGGVKTDWNIETSVLSGVTSISSGTGGILDIGTQSAASASISTVDSAINQVSTARAGLGALQSRLESASRSIAIASENAAAANSRIADADIAESMSALVRAQILQQAGISVLAQANQAPSLVLQLLK